MDCKVISTHLDAYVDGELEPTPVIEFERHLDECSNCRNELALTRLLQQGVRQIEQVAAPQSLKTRLAQALDEAPPAAEIDGGVVRTRSSWGAVLSVAAM